MLGSIFLFKMINPKIFLFSLIFMLPLVAAVGISPAMLDVDFKPGEVQTFDFMAVGTNIETYVIYPSAELNNSIVLNDFTRAGNKIFFKVTLTLPDRITEPGTHTILIGAKDISHEETMLSTVVAVQTPINVKVPYPGEYVGIVLDAPNVAENSPVNFKIICTNLGEKDASVTGKIEVYGDNNQLAVLGTEDKLVKSTENVTLSAVWDSMGQKAGKYTAKAFVYYNDKTAEDEKIFKIGTLLVNIINLPDEAIANSKNNIDIEIESMWNEKISNIWGEIKISNASGTIDSFRTVTFDLSPWEIKNATAWWDTSKIGVGEYDANMTLYYADKSNSVSEKINVVSKAAESSFSTATAIFVVIVLVIIINLIIWLAIIKKKNTKRKTRK